MGGCELEGPGKAPPPVSGGGGRPAARVGALRREGRPHPVGRGRSERRLGIFAVRRSLARRPSAFLPGPSYPHPCAPPEQALRPALLWMDVRSGEEAAQVAACGGPELVVNGGGAGPVSAEWMLPKALWLKRHEPDVFARARYVCEYQVRRPALDGGRQRGSGTPTSARDPAHAFPRRTTSCFT